jgi:hypothetical protein
MVKLRLVETDGEGRVALPDHPNKRFPLRESEDGSILLQPATAVTEAQHEYDATPELRELIAAATSSPTARKTRRRRVMRR